MDDTLPLALTPEQLTAFSTAGGVVRAEDPATKRRYVLIDEAPPRLTIDELRAMIREADESIARGEGRRWDPEEIKAEIREHYRLRGLS